jgi:Na+/alanine symporter
MLKKVLAIITGVITGFVVVFIGDAVTGRLYPPTPGLNFTDKASLDAFVAGIPSYVLIIMIVFWLFSSFLGGMVAARINRTEWKSTCLITASILMAAALLNLILIPHPMWMWLAALLGYIPAGYLGGLLIRPKSEVV